eukprot:4043848-Prymnesium_polylepis.2
MIAPKDNGMNAQFGVPVHFVAAEPQATFLRVGVIDRGREVACECCVLGRLRGGHRVLQLRGALGTRIELCFLYVTISFGSEPNLWPTSRHVSARAASPFWIDSKLVGALNIVFTFAFSVAHATFDR